MNKILKKINLYNLITSLSIIILFLFFFYKLNFEEFIPVSGDELSSILVYSSNIKTIFLKNFPGNEPFFHFFGYLKTLIIGYDLISYRAIPFIFFVLHFWVLNRMKYKNNILLIFFILILFSSNFKYYTGHYTGYIFSSFIFILIFYLIKNNENEIYNKSILFLLFIQIYNHLVNLYLVLPIILSLFIFSKKKKFIKDFLIYYLLPTIIFYSISIVLTGISVLKIPSTNFNFVILFIIENFQKILLEGFDRIFFYEAYSSAEKLNIFQMIEDFFNLNTSMFILFSICILLSFFNFKNDKKIFSLIIFFHILTFFLINKNPHPRIFTGFYCFYIFLIFDFLGEKKIILNIVNNKTYSLILLIVILIQLTNFNYLKNTTPSQYYDLNFAQNEISTNYLKKDCKLINNSFSEIQKRNYYFNYINLCNKKFNLNEFLNYYRS